MRFRLLIARWIRLCSQAILVVLFGITTSWSQGIAYESCYYAYELPWNGQGADPKDSSHIFATPEETLNDARKFAGYPYFGVRICAGNLVRLDWVLGARSPNPIYWSGEYEWTIIQQNTRAICDDMGRPVGTWEEAFEIFPRIRCLPASPKASASVFLTGPAETRPAGTGGTSSITLTAKVTDGSTAKPGIALGFSTGVTANSGGHEHHDVARPKGTLSGAQGITDANGEVKVTFTAPEVAGIHTIKATCASCSNSPVSKEIQVKVPDLLPISPNGPQNADGTFVYALTSVDITHQGNGRYHHNQYYLTQQSQINLQSMIAAFAAEGWGTVALNDASLYWGGRYDITSNWNAPHAGHREGREIDVSFARAGNPISASKQKVFYKKFCEAKTVSFPFSILHHYVKNPHFHVYLEKQTACWQSGN